MGTAEITDDQMWIRGRVSKKIASMCLRSSACLVVELPGSSFHHTRPMGSRENWAQVQSLGA